MERSDRGITDEFFAFLLRTKGTQIPWYDVMNIALYDDEYGYYARFPSLGKKGDFYTPAHVGRLYPLLFNKWLNILKNSHISSWSYIEIGAGEGNWVFHLYDLLPPQVHKVWLVEKSPFWQASLRKKIKDRKLNIHVVAALEDIPFQEASFIVGCEFLDALAVEVFRYDLKKVLLEEAYLAWNKDRFIWLWKIIDDKLPKINEFLKDMPIKEKYILEFPKDAVREMEKIISWVKNSKHGLLFWLDYMRPRCELLMKYDITLRGYYKHRLYANPAQFLPYLGEIDLTTTPPVDFLQDIGEKSSLKTLFCQSQSSFMLKSDMISFLPPYTSSPFTKEARERRHFMQLFHPQAMGEAFWLLIQTWNLNDNLAEILLPVD